MITIIENTSWNAYSSLQLQYRAILYFHKKLKTQKFMEYDF